MAFKELKGGMLRLLTEEDLNKIHNATLEVLNDIGIKMEYEPALDIFSGAKAKVDRKNKIVYIDEALVKKALTTVPHSLILYGKAEGYDIDVNINSIHTIAGSSAISILDLQGNYRMPTFEDLINITVLQENLENLHIMHGTVIPSDYEEYGIDRILFAGVYPYTKRNYYSQSQTGADGVLEQIKMAAVFQGGEDEVRKKPTFTEVSAMVSPLKHEKINSEVLIEAARNNIPIYTEVDPLMGGTTPATIAATLVEINANNLSQIILTQLVKPGAPCIYGCGAGLLDMITGSYSGAAPEAILILAASTQVSHFYNLPFHGCSGSDSKVPDAQAGYEKALQFLMSCLCGVNLIHNLGMIEQMNRASYEQCVIDSEIMGSCFKILEGVEVNDETLSMDLFKKEKDKRSNFLIYKETKDFAHKKLWIPNLTDRNTYSTWKAMGSKDMREVANQRARKIIKENRKPVINKDQAEEIMKMAIDFHKRAQKKKEKFLK